MLLALGTAPDAPDLQELWLANGGETTLAEAGISPSALSLRGAPARAEFRLAAGERSFAMLDQAPLARRAGNLVFVHAGIHPDMELDRFLDAPRLSAIDSNHPAWIRDAFLFHAGPFEGGRIVVHGHTPEPRVLRMKGRHEGPGSPPPGRLATGTGRRQLHDGDRRRGGVPPRWIPGVHGVAALGKKARTLPWTRQGTVVPWNPDRALRPPRTPYRSWRAASRR